MDEALRSLYVSVIAGLVTMWLDPAGADSVGLVVKVAAITGTIAIGIQVLRRFLQAPAEILKERLSKAGDRLKKLELQRSEKVDLLMALLVEGQNLLSSGAHLDGPAAFLPWEKEVRESFNQHLLQAAPTLQSHEWAILRHADGQGIPFDNAVSQGHKDEWRMLKQRVDALISIIQENLR